MSASACFRARRWPSADRAASIARAQGAQPPPQAGAALRLAPTTRSCNVLYPTTTTCARPSARCVLLCLLLWVCVSLCVDAGHNRGRHVVLPGVPGLPLEGIMEARACHIAHARGRGAVWRACALECGLPGRCGRAARTPRSWSRVEVAGERLLVPHYARPARADCLEGGVGGGSLRRAARWRAARRHASARAARSARALVREDGHTCVHTRAPQSIPVSLSCARASPPPARALSFTWLVLE